MSNLCKATLPIIDAHVLVPYFVRAFKTQEEVRRVGLKSAVVCIFKRKSSIDICKEFVINLTYAE